MDERKPINAQATGLMVLLCTVWALQQVAIKAAAIDVAPVLQIALRSGAASLLVGLMMIFRHEKMNWRDSWRAGIGAGILFSLEFLCVGEGLRYTTASHMVVFFYTAPIFAALGLHWKLPSERLKLIQWAGIGIAFLGIALTFYGRNVPSTQGVGVNAWLGDLLGLIAGASWGATTVLIRNSLLSNAPATQTLFYQLFSAFVLLLIAAFSLGQTHFQPTYLAMGSLMFQAVIVSFASYLTWFWLLRRYLASRLGVLSFMTPIFGVILGVFLLNEPLELSFVFGALLVLSGIFLVTSAGFRFSRKAMIPS